MWLGCSDDAGGVTGQCGICRCADCAEALSLASAIVRALRMVVRGWPVLVAPRRSRPARRGAPDRLRAARVSVKPRYGGSARLAAPPAGDHRQPAGGLPRRLVLRSGRGSWRRRCRSEAAWSPPRSSALRGSPTSRPSASHCRASAGRSDGSPTWTSSRALASAERVASLGSDLLLAFPAARPEGACLEQHASRVWPLPSAVCQTHKGLSNKCRYRDPHYK